MAQPDERYLNATTTTQNDELIAEMGRKEERR